MHFHNYPKQRPILTLPLSFLFSIFILCLNCCFHRSSSSFSSSVAADRLRRMCSVPHLISSRPIRSLDPRERRAAMAEEQRCQEGHRLCANNCGFFGSPATLNLCSKCYRDHRLKEDHANSAKIAVEKSLLASSSSSSSPSPSPSSTSGDVNDKAVVSPLVLTPPPLPLPVVSKEEEPAEVAPALPPAQTTTATTTASANRCTSCRKRVGLTGFRCRCGSTYCGAHRYAEKHACTFDFKSAGREAIARANPLVKADKLGNKI